MIGTEDLNQLAIGREWEHRNIIRGSMAPTVIAIDPGETTGWTLMRVGLAVLDDRLALADNIAMHIHGQVDCGKGVGELEDIGPPIHGFRNTEGESQGVARLLIMMDRYPGAAIVIEDFIPNFKKLTKDRAGLSPVRVTARLEQELWQRGRYVHIQAVSEAKGTMTDDRLKEFDMYERAGGLKHARDSDRHAMLFLRRAQNSEELRHKAWPHLFGPPQPKTTRKRAPKKPGTIIQLP